MPIPGLIRLRFPGLFILCRRPLRLAACLLSVAVLGQGCSVQSLVAPLPSSTASNAAIAPKPDPVAVSKRDRVAGAASASLRPPHADQRPAKPAMVTAYLPESADIESQPAREPETGGLSAFVWLAERRAQREARAAAAIDSAFPTRETGRHFFASLYSAPQPEPVATPREAVLAPQHLRLDPESAPAPPETDSIESENGFAIAHSNVATACLKPELQELLKSAQDHFRKPVRIHSGYRDPDHNRRVGGAPKSMHLHCMAADIQIEGVSKFDIAAYFRTLANIGGVGTYCAHDSVHVDIGPRRDWHRDCRLLAGKPEAE